MLILNKADMLRCISPAEVLAAVERAFAIYAQKDFYMPPRPHIENGRDTLLYMPCFIKGIFGTKFLTLFPGNPELGRPMIDGLMLLNDSLTGAPLALLDAKLLTSLRTGAVAAGMGCKYLSPKGVESLSLIGCGTQGFYQALYACMVRSVKKIILYDSAAGDLSGFINRLNSELGRKLDAEICVTADAAARLGDVIITATTSETPVFSDDSELFAGKTVIAIGSYKPYVRELPDAVFKAAENVVTDCGIALEESGDLAIPIKTGVLDSGSVIQMSEILSGKKIKPGGVFYKSVGMALFDLVTAQAVYEKALYAGLGQNVDI